VFAADCVRLAYGINPDADRNIPPSGKGSHLWERCLGLWQDAAPGNTGRTAPGPFGPEPPRQEPVSLRAPLNSLRQSLAEVHARASSIAPAQTHPTDLERAKEAALRFLDQDQGPTRGYAAPEQQHRPARHLRREFRGGPGGEGRRPVL
jgi:hypothetical protein